MTDKKMEQEVGSGAIAIQSNRDTNIGFTPEQVMDAIAAQIPAFGAIAREIVESRVADFKEEMLNKLAANEARIEAFSDPAFVNTVNNAEKTYAFSDDDAVQTVLLDLIANRSKETKRSRKSLTFDQSVEVSGNLTKPDFSALSLVFIFRYTANNTIGSPDAFASYIRTSIDPFVGDISEEQSAYSYLEAQRCATISIGSASFEKIMKDNYGGIISKGLTREAIAEAAPRLGFPTNLFLRCFHAPDALQVAALNRRVWDDKTSGMDKDATDRLWSLHETTLMSNDEIFAAYAARAPNLQRFAELWESTALKNLQLTTIGICIGYMNAKRTVGFDADLDIWIR